MAIGPDDFRTLITEQRAGISQDHPGLYFVGPYYDAAFAIPQHTPALDWLP